MGNKMRAIDSVQIAIDLEKNFMFSGSEFEDKFHS